MLRYYLDMKNTRKKKMISLAIDPDVLADLEKWIARQQVAPSKTAVIEAALRAFIGDEHG